MEGDDDGLKHFFHPHRLSFIEVSEEDGRVVNKVCDGCTDIIRGPTYACMTCTGEDKQFVMHKSCAELPLEIHRDALHPHPLILNQYFLIVCDRCGILSSFRFNYKCSHCMFHFDFRCAISLYNNDELLNHEVLQKGGQIKTIIHHFCHNHPLTRSLFLPATTKHAKEILKDLWDDEAISCLACNKELQQETTAICICLPCRFILHESCLNRMLKRVQSPFHPQHILLPRVIRKHYSHECYACQQRIKGISFYCNQCDANLHVSCAKHLTRAVRLINRHPHHLLHFGESITTKILCYACHYGTNRGSFFCCIECPFRIHVECISLPARVEHIRHMHPLVLVSSVIEDDAEEYYCDICEIEGNPEHHVYCCRECNYIAHVDCVVPELVEHAKEVLLDLQQIEENSNKRLELDNEKIIQKDALHPHPLTLNEDDAEVIFVCDSCGEVGCGLSYCCSPCQFNLHTKCVAALNNDEMTKKRGAIKTIISDIHHDHPLTRCKIPDHHPFLQSCCSACKHGVCGVMYICLFCGFIIHESCLEGMPLQLRSQFDPQHLLSCYLFSENGWERCYVCNEKIQHIVLVCLEGGCNILMHYSCTTYKTCEIIIHDSHVHSLVHLGKTIFVNESPECDACGAKCENTLFGCIECKFFTHLECIKLPYVVKHKRHLHSLTLTNSVVEDDTGNYYGDICETERNSENNVYYCKDCNYIAHIHCLINSEVEDLEEILEYLVPRSRVRKVQELE